MTLLIISACWMVLVIPIGMLTFGLTAKPREAKNDGSRAVSVLLRSAYWALLVAPYIVAPPAFVAPASLVAVAVVSSAPGDRATSSHLIACGQSCLVTWGLCVAFYIVRLIVPRKPV